MDGEKEKRDGRKEGEGKKNRDGGRKGEREVGWKESTWKKGRIGNVCGTSAGREEGREGFCFRKHSTEEVVRPLLHT